MIKGAVEAGNRVNCRIGSLEIIVAFDVVSRFVNCRIGSLERNGTRKAAGNSVNCRIGSLEKDYEEFYS